VPAFEPFRDLIIEHGGVLDAAVVAATAKHLRAHGATILRGGPQVTMADFEQLTSQVGTDFIAYDFADREDLDAADKTLRTVTLGQHEIPVHSEFSDVPCRPEIGCLFCIEPSERGGESTLCDGVAVLAAVSEATRRTLKERRLLYVRLRDRSRAEQEVITAGKMRTIASEFKKPVLGTFDIKPPDDPVLYTYAVPAIVPGLNGADALCTHICRVLIDPRRKVMFEDGSPLGDSMTKEILAAIAGHTLQILMRPGDIMLFDNMRWMHGRLAFVGKRVMASRFGFMRA